MRKTSHNQQNSLSLQIKRWGIVVVIFTLVAIFEILEHSWLATFPKGLWITIESLFLGIYGAALYLLVDRSLKWSEERYKLVLQVEEAEKQVARANQRQSIVFQISQMFAQVDEEHQAVELLLRLAQELGGADGASFVLLDERAQPLPAITAGKMPFPVSDAWLEYLASPTIRQQCSACSKKEAINLECPLLHGSSKDSIGIYCLPLRRGEQEYGVLNLYFADPEKITKDAQELLRKIMDETALSLEGIRLNKRALATLRQLQAVREKADLNSLLSHLLESLCETLEADYAQVSVLENPGSQPKQVSRKGSLNDNVLHLVEGVVLSVLASGEPVSLGNMTGDSGSSPGMRSLLAVPLVVQQQNVLGALVVSSQKEKAFSQRQLSMLQTVAGQMALVLQNINLIAELEFKTMMEERTRLAREIHDGLAQTLGFLKLKLAQIQGYFVHAEFDRLQETVQVCYETVTSAYADARQAIDGLRIDASDAGLQGWIYQTVNEFGENTGLDVEIVEPVDNIKLAPEVHAQLIRIVQEALNNIRKHAQASKVWVSCQDMAGDLILEVRDDGIGFDVDDIPGPSRYGLQGMRERAELIGADFQVIGCPEHGATVRVRLPMGLGEKQS